MQPICFNDYIQHPANVMWDSLTDFQSADLMAWFDGPRGSARSWFDRNLFCQN